MQLQRTIAAGLLAGAASLTIWLVGCGGDSGTNPPPPDTSPASLSIVSGSAQSAQVSTALANPLVVRVANAANQSLQAITVNWTVTQGGGVLGAATSTTNAQGQASNTYTVGSSAGANEVRASVQGAPSIFATFAATATAAPDLTPASIERVGGDNQSATVGQALPNPLVVKVTNAASQVLQGIVVAWSVTQGGGALGAATSTTNAQGEASNSYTVGASAGANQIKAEIQSNAAINTIFNATASGAPSAVSVAVTNFQFTPQSATVASGGTVTWNFNQGTHNVTWVSGGFTNSGDKAAGTHAVTFPSTGTFQYFCSIHGSAGSGMHGSVTVQ